MSHALFSRNDDLTRLREEGYFVQVIGGFLVMREVPYVDDARKVRFGTLISSLALAGDETRKPDTHVVHFDGEYPCHADGTPIQSISNQTRFFDLGHGLKARHAFSSKPTGGYGDYYEKMSTYAAILSGPAARLEKSATPRCFRTPEEEEDSIFNYTETASDRAGIGAVSEKLADQRVAIIGLGGSGSYILDFVAKSPVREIRLFDGDEFLQHNAFRAPGAPSIEELREAPKKVDYLSGIYSRMHRGISTTPEPLGENNIDLLNGISFAFLSLDAGETKALIVEKLVALDVAFIDVGMGIELSDSGLTGILRATVSTVEHRETAQKHIPLEGGGENDLYSSNIQVADLNALNAILAVIKWKKLCSFYCDFEGEHHMTYTIDGNFLQNGGHSS